jgi:chromosomal replication initiator protein
LLGGKVTDGIATLSFEPLARNAKRSAKDSTQAGVLREYVLGPENQLLRWAIGLSGNERGETASADARLADAGVRAGGVHVRMVPLLIHAPFGFGKSQLLQALAANWPLDENAKGVVLTNAADFARAFATAVKLDEVARFQQRYQRADLLLIDDLHELQRKPGAQRQLGAIVEHRQRHDRPVVLTANQPLRSLGLVGWLSSRLASGLELPLQLPDQACRLAILDQLCQAHQVPLTPAARQRLAQQPSLTIPQLITLVAQLGADGHAFDGHTGLAGGANGTPIDESQVAALVRHAPLAAIEPKEIIRAAAHFFGLRTRNLTGASRRKLDVLARSIAMYVIRDLTGLSFQQIGQYFGRRDHTTVIHACRKVAANHRRDATTRSAIGEIMRRLPSAGSETSSTDKPWG